jgi:hypothetical protein
MVFYTIGYIRVAGMSAEGFVIQRDLTIFCYYELLFTVNCFTENW